MRQQPSLDEYVYAIKALPERTPLQKTDILIDDFLIYRENELEIYYAPLDYVNPQAKVIIVGITPGWTQMELAYRQARSDLLAGLSGAEVCRRAKQRAGFAGRMRPTLVSMLDDIGLAGQLGLGGSELLFSSHRALLHTTSAIRYPVFADEEDYTGHKPKLLRHEVLRQYIDTLLVEELQAAGEAVIVPSGQAVSEALSYLVERQMLDERRCLIGFPHPSGRNVRRKQQFDERKEELRARLQSWYASHDPHG